MQPKSIILFFYGYILFFRRQYTIILQKLRKEMSKTSQKFMNSFKSYKRNKMGCYKVGFL